MNRERDAGGVVFVDPGETCGVATWVNRLELWQAKPEAVFSYVESNAIAIAVLGIEEFRLYPWASQEWSTFLTVEVIGTLKYIAKKAGIRVVMQPSSVMKAARRIARARGVNLIQPNEGYRGGKDAKAAELHLFAYMQRRGRTGEVREWA